MPEDSSASAPTWDDSAVPVRHLVITVHGIRTFGRWQERLESMLRAEVGQSRQLTVFAYKYGYFSVLAFLVPFLRWLITLRFRRAILRAAQDGPWDRIDLVGHSFGTHIIGWGLHGINRELRPSVHTIILSGSVLKTDFPWEDLLAKDVTRVVNECGTRDKILLLSQFAVLFTGMAGRVGFAGMTGRRLRNRFFPFGHSGYFLQNGIPDDAFMRKYWLPLITRDVEVPLVDERQESIFSGPLTFLANNAEPIKLTVYLTPFLIAIWAIYGLYVEAEEQRQAAMSRVLALESREAADSRDYELAVRLSLEALRVRDTPETRRSLLHSVAPTLGGEFFSYLCCAQDAISALGFTEHGDQLFAGDAKGNLLRWDLETPEKVTAQPSSLGEPFKGKVLHIGTTDGGKRLVAISTKQASSFYLDATSLRQKSIHLPFPEISSAVLSDDGNRLAVGDPMGRIAVLDHLAEKWSAPMADPKLRMEVIGLAFHPNAERLAASYSVPQVEGFKQPIVMWNVSTGQREDPPFIGHRFEVMSLDFTPDGKQLASGSWDQDIRLWDTATGQIIPPVLVRAAQETKSIRSYTAPTQVAISPDGEILASVMSDTVALWDMANHKSTAQFTGLLPGPTTLAFSRKGKLIAVGGKDKNVVLIPTDLKYWLKTACEKIRPRALTAQEERYYLGDVRDRGAFAAWLWKTYWSIRSSLGGVRYQPRVAEDLC